MDWQPQIETLNILHSFAGFEFLAILTVFCLSWLIQRVQRWIEQTTNPSSSKSHRFSN